MQPPIDLSSMTHDQKDALIMQLAELVERMQSRIDILEGQLAQNSRNSSKPPSSDGLKPPKPKPKSLRGKSGKRSGGQSGHKGHTLKQVEHPDHVIEHSLDHCTGCGHDLSATPAQAHEARQVFDIPPVNVEVSEHRAQIKSCPCCQKRSRAAFPDGICQPVQYGNRIQAAVVYLSQYQLLPYARLQELFQDLYQLSLSQGTINNMLDRGYQRLDEFEESARQMVIGSDLAHFDETGMRVNKHRHWLHVASTDSVTFYFIHYHRGTPAMQAMGVLEQFDGYAVHDHYSSYYVFDVWHVACNAHHLRELIFAHEQFDQKWAQKLILCLLEAKQEADEAREAGVQSLSDERINYYANRYSRILREGRIELPVLPAPEKRTRGRVAQHKVKNLFDRLTRHKHETLGFVYDLSVPFDNNLAERDVRMAKTKQKISGCFRSEKGAQVFCRLRGYISTAKKQGRNVYSALRDAFEGNAFDPTSALDPQTG